MMGILQQTIILTLTLTVVKVTCQTGQKVIVVGAGFSGITAARELQNLDYDVVVLEASSRPGGRIWSYDLGDAAVVDLGATFLYGDEEPVKNKAEELKVSLVNITMLNCDVKNETGQSVDTSMFAREVLDFLLTLSKQKEKYDPSYSISKALTESELEPYIKAREPWWRVARHILESIMGGDLKNLSLAVKLPSAILQFQTHLAKDGLQTLIESMIMGNGEDEKQLKVLYNSKVTKISHLSTSEILVTVGNTVITAKHVVMAVPLGVLKAGDIVFSPPLSDSKLAAMQRTGVGITNKLFIEFDRAFWRNNGEAFLGYLPAQSENSNSLVYWLNYAKITGKPVLVGVLTGQEAVDSESMTPEAVRDKGLQYLRKMFGSSVVDSSVVVNYNHTRWGSNPLFRGSHVYRRPETQSDDFKELMRSEGYLHFIGDYTEMEVPGLGTLQSAYIAAKRVQQNILYTDGFTTPVFTGEPDTNTYAKDDYDNDNEGPSDTGDLVTPISNQFTPTTQKASGDTNKLVTPKSPNDIPTDKSGNKATNSAQHRQSPFSSMFYVICILLAALYHRS